MACKLQTLTQNNLVHVQNCSCGLVHLHFGAFSMRVPESDLHLLTESLLQAGERLEQKAVKPKKSPSYTRKMVFRVE